MQETAWASDWFPRALVAFLTRQEALPLAVWALQTRRHALRRVLLCLHGPLLRISDRELVVCAASAGDWDAVVSLQRRCKPTSQHVRKKQHTRRLCEEIHAIEVAAGVAVSAAQAHAMRLQRGHPVGFPSQVVYNAAQRGRLEEVMWLAGIIRYEPLEAIEAAARGNHGRVVQWLLDQATQTREEEGENDDRAQRQVLQCGIRLEDPELADLGVVTWREEPRNISHGFMQGRGYLPRHFERRSFPGYPVMDWAASQGDVELLERFSKHPVASKTLTSCGIERAAAEGHLVVIQWAWQYNKYLVSSTSVRILAEAARRGDMQMLQSMLDSHDGALTGSMTSVFDAACSGGHLDTVRWAFQHLFDKRFWPRYLLTTAAEAGHLDIVKYLNEERGESITGWTVSRAVAQGHLHVAKWLAEHESLTTVEWKNSKLVVMAVESGSMATLRWVMDDLELSSDQAHEKALHARGGAAVTMLDYFWERSQPALQTFLARAGVERLLLLGAYDLVEWILRHIPESISDEVKEARIAWFSTFLTDSEVQNDGQTPQTQYALRSYPTSRGQISKMKIIEMLLQYRPRFCCHIKRFPRWAARRGDLQTLIKLEQINHPQVHADAVLTEMLKCTRKLEPVRWFLERRSLTPQLNMHVIRWSAQLCALPILQFVFKTWDGNIEWLRYAAWHGARFHHAEVLDFVRQCIAQSEMKQGSSVLKVLKGIDSIAPSDSDSWHARQIRW